MYIFTFQPDFDDKKREEKFKQLFEMLQFQFGKPPKVDELSGQNDKPARENDNNLL